MKLSCDKGSNPATPTRLNSNQLFFSWLLFCLYVEVEYRPVFSENQDFSSSFLRPLFCHLASPVLYASRMRENLTYGTYPAREMAEGQ